VFHVPSFRVNEGAATDGASLARDISECASSFAERESGGLDFLSLDLDLRLRLVKADAVLMDLPLMECLVQRDLRDERRSISFASCSR
jgi:hypothetical protein